MDEDRHRQGTAEDQQKAADPEGDRDDEREAADTEGERGGIRPALAEGDGPFERDEGAEEPEHHEYAVHVRKPLRRSRFPLADEEERGIQAGEHAEPRGGEESRAHTPSRGEVGGCLRGGVRHGAPPTAAWSSPLHPTRCPRGQSLTRGRGRSPRG